MRDDWLLDIKHLDELFPRFVIQAEHSLVFLNSLPLGFTRRIGFRGVYRAGLVSHHMVLQARPLTKRRQLATICGYTDGPITDQETHVEEVFDTLSK